MDNCAEIARLREEHAAALATPLVSEGALSGTQLVRMSERQRREYQRRVSERYDVEAQIRWLSLSEEERTRRERGRELKDARGRLDSIRAGIRFLLDAGQGKRGIRPTYARKIEAMEQERAAILERYPELA